MQEFRHPSTVPVFICPTQDYFKVCYPRSKNREALAFHLIEADNLLKHFRLMKLVKAHPEDITRFHSRNYIELLKAVSSQKIDHSNVSDEMIEAGLCDDSCPFPNVFEYVQFCVGGSILAAQELIKCRTKLAIWWGGGRHHAKWDSAAGFCFANDICIAITILQQHFSRIMYIDLDAHHGDGVEEAFLASNTVLTFSIHRAGKGFYPGTGILCSTGFGKGKAHAINVPLKRGASDATLQKIYDQIVEPKIETYNPQVLVIQCGADSLAHDPMGELNFSSDGYLNFVGALLKKSIPIMLTGGGGYNDANVARLWTLLTALCVPLPNLITDLRNSSIPDHDYFPKYSPSFTHDIPAARIRDENSTEYMETVIKRCMS